MLRSGATHSGAPHEMRFGGLPPPNPPGACISSFTTKCECAVEALPEHRDTKQSHSGFILDAVSRSGSILAGGARMKPDLALSG